MIFPCNIYKLKNKTLQSLCIHLSKMYIFDSWNYREGSIKIGDRILAINDYNVAHFSLAEASVFLQQCGREVNLMVEYDVSLMGEGHHTVICVNRVTT